jgi:hypothetical protein
MGRAARSALHRVAAAHTAEPAQQLFDQCGVATLLRAVDRPALAGNGQAGAAATLSSSGRGHKRILEDKPAMVAVLVLVRC